MKLQRFNCRQKLRNGDDDNSLFWISVAEWLGVRDVVVKILGKTTTFTGIHYPPLGMSTLGVGYLRITKREGCVRSFGLYHFPRHFKATMEYHKTKDILHVMRILGHKCISNTLIYTHLVDFKDDEYTVKVAHSIEEDKQLIEAGFQYVTDRDNFKIYKKRK